MTDLLGHALGQTWFILAILAHDGVSQVAEGTLGAFQAQFWHDSGMTDLLGHAVGQT